MSPKASATLAFFAVLTGLAAPAAADDLVVETAVSTAYYQDHSFDAVSNVNAYSELAVSGAWGFDKLGGLQLGVLFAAQPGRLQTYRFGDDLFLEWGRQRVLATAGWGADIWWFRPNVSLGVGYAHQFLSVYGSGPRLKDHTHDLAGQLSGGLDLNVPVRWGFVGFTTEVGYQAQTAANFDEMRNDRKAFEADYAPEEDPWDRAHADYGKLRTSGIFWSIGVNVTFAL